MEKDLELALEFIDILVIISENLASGFEKLSALVPIKEGHTAAMSKELENIMLSSLGVTNRARIFIQLMKEKDND